MKLLVKKLVNTNVGVFLRNSFNLKPVSKKIIEK